jgi:glycosyltransferase involved in cell wall biosynthesis
MAHRFDEIWAPSRFVANSFPPGFGRPVRLVPQPVRTSVIPAEGAPQSDFLQFYTYLDFDSHSARKNPTAAVRAFQAAFPAGQRDVQLLIKARGGQDSGMRDWLAATTADDSRIQLIDRTLDRAQMDALMRECDAFISLHRSEGFGFGAAEALAAAKPVVSTDYGGTTDFVTTETGYPVAYDLVQLKRGDYPGWEGQVWAEPRLDATVEALRSVYRNRSAAAAKGRRGQTLLRELYAPAVVGTRVQELLQGLGCLETV